MPSKVWDEITYPFPNFNGCTVEVREWMSNFISQFMIDVIIYPCWNEKEFQMASWISVIIGSGNDLSPVGAKT